MKLYLALAIFLTVLFGTLGPSAVGQTRVAGHVGFVLPLVTNSDGSTTTLADEFSIGFPTGITLKGPGRLAFDMDRLVPSIQKSPRSVSLTVHPGFVEAVGRGFAVGVRAAFVVNSSTYGFTPLVNKSWPIEKPGLLKAYFFEADLPVRFDRPTGGPATTPVTFAMHFGVGF